MQFSILIPAYNYAQYLPNALDSVLKQPGNHYEIIVIDDGSTDNTRAILKAYADQYPNKLRWQSQPNQGQAAARNAAAQLAKGTYLLPFDADDELTPDALAIWQNAVTKNSQAKIFIAPHLVYSDKDEQLKFGGALSTSLAKNFLKFLRKQLSLSHGAVLLHREVMQKLAYPANITGREDTVFFAQALAQFPAAKVSSPTVKIRKHENSFRHRSFAHKGKELIVDTLFNPNQLPEGLMPYRNEFAARLSLSFFRENYKLKNYRLARQWYYEAFRLYPISACQWVYFSKWLRSFFK